MKLQVAIDRVSLDEATAIIKEINTYTDIIEIGTSLIKEYGLHSLAPLTKSAILLGDIKTCDEGAYEFNLGFELGFKYLTVMGNSSFDTLKICYQTAQQHQQEIMIDLLECSSEKIQSISYFSKAIYCLHTSVDTTNKLNPLIQIQQFKAQFSQIKRIAVAGGISPEQLPKLKELNVEIAIIGSAITKHTDKKTICKQCKELLK